MARRWLGLSSSTQRRSPTPRLSVDCVSIDGNGGAGPCKRYRAIVAYDGTDFLGFQAQDHRGLPVRTVQGALEAALQRLVGSSSRVLGAGRTDAGVHASGQVIHVDLSVGRFGVHELHRALNAVLPRDIRVLAFEAAPDGFHARFSALSRSYRYLIDNGPQATPSLRRIAWHVLDHGWEIEDPALVGTAMEQLSRLAFHVVWVNPRKAARGCRNSTCSPCAPRRAPA